MRDRRVRVRVHVDVVVMVILSDDSLVIRRVTDTTAAVRHANQEVVDGLDRTAETFLRKLRLRFRYVHVLVAVLVQVRFRRRHDQQAALIVVCERDVCQSRESLS